MAKKLTKKERVLHEKLFLSCVLSMTIHTDWRGVTGKIYKDASWRRFAERAHQALWRALQSFDLKDGYERRVAAEKEIYAEAGFACPSHEGEADPVRGLPGSAADKAFHARASARSSARARLERELENTGSLAVVGGKIYLRELYDMYPAEDAAFIFAHKLGFMSKEEAGEKEAKLKQYCWNCARALGRPRVMTCETDEKTVTAYDGADCGLWEKPFSLYEKIMKSAKEA